MLHTTTTKITLIALLATGVLAAFPEPFDFHCTLHEDIERMMELRNDMSCSDRSLTREEIKQQEKEARAAEKSNKDKESDRSNRDTESRDSSSSNNSHCTDIDRASDTDAR